MKLTPEKLNMMYNHQKMSDSEIGQELGVSRRTITRWRDKMGIVSKRDALIESLPSSLTKTQEEMLIGTMMGDGHICSTRTDQSTAKFQLVHGKKQEGYLRAKMDILRPFTSKIQSYVERKKGEEYAKSAYPMVRGYTYRHPVFSFYRDLFYENGRKTFKNIWDRVTHTSLGYWYLDDGTVEGSGFRILVSKKMRNDALKAIEVLREKFGYLAYHREAYGQSGVDHIRISTESSELFYHECLKPILVPCVSYKVSYYSDNPEPSLDGNVLEGVETKNDPTVKTMGSSMSQRSDFLGSARDTLTNNVEGEDIVRPAQRCADSSRNDLGVQR